MKVIFKVLDSKADTKADEGAALESKDQSSSVRETEGEGRGGAGNCQTPAVIFLTAILCLTYFFH